MLWHRLRWQPRRETEVSVKRYVKAILGGFLAILAAFGWAIAVLFLLTEWFGGFFVSTNHGQIISVVVLTLIFAAGFFLAFRVAYSRISN